MAAEQSATVGLALVGPGGLVGEAVLGLLAERQLPIGAPHLLDREAGARVAFGNRQLTVEAWDAFDFASVAVVIVATDAEDAAELVPRVAESGAIAIDLSGASAMDPEIPLVAALLDRAAVGEYGRHGILATPAPLTLAVATVLAPLQAAAGVARVNAVALEPVSAQGRAGVEELAGQTADLLNMRTVRSDRFGRQIAFNLLPQVGALDADGASLAERRLADELRRLLQAPELGVNATAVQAPVFFGHGVVLHVETVAPVSAEAAQHLLAQAPGVRLFEEAPWPTPVTEAVGEDAVAVGRLRDDPSHPSGLDLWLVADNVRFGSAVNGVQIFEILVKDYLEMGG